MVVGSRRRRPALAARASTARHHHHHRCITAIIITTPRLITTITTIITTTTTTWRRLRRLRPRRSEARRYRAVPSAFWRIALPARVQPGRKLFLCLRALDRRIATTANAFCFSVDAPLLSPPRKRGSRHRRRPSPHDSWMPAFAGMTGAPGLRNAARCFSAPDAGQPAEIARRPSPRSWPTAPWRARDRGRRRARRRGRLGRSATISATWQSSQ